MVSFDVSLKKRLFLEALLIFYFVKYSFTAPCSPEESGEE